MAELPEAWDKVAVRMLFDWSHQPPDMLLDEELQMLETIINNAVDEHYGDTTTLELTTVTYEGKLPIGVEEEGWTINEEAIWNRIPGDTREEKLEWVRHRMEDEA